MEIVAKLPTGAAPGGDIRKWVADNGGSLFRSPPYEPGAGHDPESSWFVCFPKCPPYTPAKLNDWGFEIIWECPEI